jgi:hypothetical protein
MTAEGKNLPAAETEPRWLDTRTQGGVTARVSTPDFPIEYAVSWAPTCIQKEVTWTQEAVRFALPAEWAS